MRNGVAQNAPPELDVGRPEIGGLGHFQMMFQRAGTAVDADPAHGRSPWKLGNHWPCQLCVIIAFDALKMLNEGIQTGFSEMPRSDMARRRQFMPPSQDDA